MPFENQYIHACQNIKNILINEQDISICKGKRQEKFGNKAPIVLEIGTGQGNFFARQIMANPEKNYIGMEIRWKRIFSTYIKASKYGSNFFILKEYAQKVSEIFGSKEISEIYIFFPDPWPKEKQKHNRLFQKKFLQDIYEISTKKGKLYIKTDDQKYFLQLLEEIKNTDWQIKHFSFDYEKDKEIAFDTKHITEFEGIWRGYKKSICYLEGAKN